MGLYTCPCTRYEQATLHAHYFLFSRDWIVSKQWEILKIAQQLHTVVYYFWRHANLSLLRRKQWPAKVDYLLLMLGVIFAADSKG